MLMLFVIMGTLAFNDLQRGQQIEIQTLREKSAVLIRSFESGTRTGMGMRWQQEQRQRLLEEMANQPSVLYIAITDRYGTIMAHSDRSRVGQPFYSPEQIRALRVSDEEQWQMTYFIDQQQNKQQAFEVYRFFKPLKRQANYSEHRTNHHRPPALAADEPPTIIFVGFDTLALDAAQAKDLRNSAILFSTLLLLALASLLALFWAQRYQRSNRQLADSKTVASEIIRNLPIGLITTNEQQNITVVNPAAEAMLGCDAQAWIGQKSDQLLPPSWNDKTTRDQAVIEQETEYPLANGERLPLSVSIANIVNHQGYLLGNLFIFRDMREVRQLQADIRRKEKLAAIGDLAAGVAHEIRNPLSSIKGFAKYFADRAAQGSEEHELAQVMAKEVDRLNRVVSELLSVVRPPELRLQLTDINPLIEHSLYLIQQDAAQQQISLRYQRNPQLPMVEIDPDHLTQALLNLYLNALQAIGRHGWLAVNCAVLAGDKLQIVVHDSAGSINADDLNKIFNPYFTTKANGTGLGLVIVQKVIEEHQGHIVVSSSAQAGTRFEMTLPLQQKKAKGD
ncbi:ATP-binding protein [Serratia microhaemolytica]|uniref:ATP-binding protein n=1 Tax=Serratia microhaemolytica TaxID=2675110 RepID=UPI000FDDC315